MELLTDIDRVRLVAALGQSVLTARAINQEALELLLKLSGPDVRIWTELADNELLPTLGPNFATADTDAARPARSSKLIRAFRELVG